MISVIIPVYNVEQYLPFCINSILKSNYTDFELILVNDGSTDNNREICEYYRCIDKRIQVINTENRGVSMARNEGLKRCRGEWVVFVDADDCICPNFLKIVSSQPPVDILIFDFIEITNYSFKRKKYKNCMISFSLGTKDEKADYINKILNNKPIVPKGRKRLGTPWAKAFRRKTLLDNAMHFIDGINIGEDAIFNIELVLCAKSCIYISVPVYFYRIRPSSISHEPHFDCLKSFLRWQTVLYRILIQNEIFQEVREAYMNSTLQNIAYILIRRLYAPTAKLSMDESKTISNKILNEEIFQTALKYNYKLGTFPRRIILGLFRRRLYSLVRILCRWSLFILLENEKKCEKKWNRLNNICVYELDQYYGQEPP